jgi:hypothetical protein
MGFCHKHSTLNINPEDNKVIGRPEGWWCGEAVAKEGGEVFKTAMGLAIEKEDLKNYIGVAICDVFVEKILPIIKEYVLEREKENKS